MGGGGWKIGKMQKDKCHSIRRRIESKNKKNKKSGKKQVLRHSGTNDFFFLFFGRNLNFETRTRNRKIFSRDISLAT